MNRSVFASSLAALLFLGAASIHAQPIVKGRYSPDLAAMDGYLTNNCNGFIDPEAKLFPSASSLIGRIAIKACPSRRGESPEKGLLAYELDSPRVIRVYVSSSRIRLNGMEVASLRVVRPKDKDLESSWDFFDVEAYYEGIRVPLSEVVEFVDPSCVRVPGTEYWASRSERWTDQTPAETSIILSQRSGFGASLYLKDGLAKGTYELWATLRPVGVFADHPLPKEQPVVVRFTITADYLNTEHEHRSLAGHAGRHPDDWLWAMPRMRKAKPEYYEWDDISMLVRMGHIEAAKVRAEAFYDRVYGERGPRPTPQGIWPGGAGQPCVFAALLEIMDEKIAEMQRQKDLGLAPKEVYAEGMVPAIRHLGSGMGIEGAGNECLYREQPDGSVKPVIVGFDVEPLESRFTWRKPLTTPEEFIERRWWPPPELGIEMPAPEKPPTLTTSAELLRYAREHPWVPRLPGVETIDPSTQRDMPGTDCLAPVEADGSCAEE